ncbi:MAG: hypothetical protein V2A79_06535 [Planctomycetota bacterium]
MAAAKAQAKGGVSGIHIWLIVFVALWLASTVLLVLLYTDQAELKQKNAELMADVDKGRSELRAKEAERAATATAAAGEPAATPEVVKTKLAELCVRIAEDKSVPDAAAFRETSYLQALTTLLELFKGQGQKLAQALEHNQALGDQVDQLASVNTTQKTAFDEQVTDVAGKLDDLKTAGEDYAKTRDREIDGFDRKLADADARANADIQRMREELKRMLAKFDELQNRYGELKERLGELQIRPQELITARQADARVVTAKPGEPVVYIDIGRDAGLVLGLQFAVYSAATGIPADGQAKARIEVVNIFDTSAECRIVDVRGREPILVGDLAANPVFDRERALQFMVIGGFDVNGDGQPDPEGATQIESLIREWGGAVTQELSARVDFLVVGDAPVKPFQVGDQTPEAQARFEAAKKLYDTYHSTLQTAQALSIPMLTRGVFMHFLGYARG